MPRKYHTGRKKIKMCIAKLNLKFQNKTRQKHTYRNQNNQNLMKNDNIQYTKI